MRTYLYYRVALLMISHYLNFKTLFYLLILQRFFRQLLHWPRVQRDRADCRVWRGIRHRDLLHVYDPGWCYCSSAFSRLQLSLRYSCKDLNMCSCIPSFRRHFFLFKIQLGNLKFKLNLLGSLLKILNSVDKYSRYLQV